MKCKLCCDENELKNSHIIPEFIYKTLYDEKHRFFEISMDSDKGPKLQQSGLKEKLLCSKCEQLFSKYERYASLVLNKGYELRVRQDGPVIHFHGIDYSKFKLFALSVLWRAGVSAHATFSQVKLGLHEEKLRALLLDENPGKESEYPFILCPIIHENDVVEAFIVQPTPTKIGSNCAYRFVFGGLVWVYVVSSHKAPQAIIDSSITKKNTITMIPWKLSKMGFIVDMTQSAIKNKKL